MPCIWANQDGIKPSGSFAVLDLGTARTLGTEVRRNLTKQKVCETKERTLSIDGFDVDMSGLWQKLNAPSIVERCFAAKICFMQVLAVNDLTALLDSRTWKERTNMEILLTHADYIEDDSSYIDQVDITGELKDSEVVPTPETPTSIVNVQIEMEVE